MKGEASSVPELVRDHGGRRERTRDDHRFQAALGFRTVSCRVQLFTGAGLRPVVLATQAEDEPCPSLMNASERVAAHVWRNWLPGEPEPPIWIERQIESEVGLLGPVGAADYVRYVAGADFTLTAPTRRPMTADQLVQLVGGPVELDRGSEYVPPPPPPKYVMRYRPTAVADLPWKRPYRVSWCMPVREQRWRHRLWRRLPRPLRRCRCWYHRGDWNVVNDIALRLLADAEAAGVGLDDVREHVREHVRTAAAGENLDAWTFSALDTLFSDPISYSVAEDGAKDFSNGIHRTQAMRDAGVVTTITASDELVVPHPLV